MSIITDGMAQIHSELPWQGNNSNFQEILTQHLQVLLKHNKSDVLHCLTLSFCDQGVLEHGTSTVSIFRSYENVVNGANLAIHSLLRVLENRLRLKGFLPETIFIQIDGGSENTAKAFLGICELLVSRGVTRKIVLSRLPAGLLLI